MKDLDEALISKYENILYKAQNYKIPDTELTIFDTAFRKHHENPLTEILYFFLDHNQKHQLETAFYNGFIHAIRSCDEYSEFEFGQLLEIKTQHTTEKGNRIDLWFQTDTALVIVEVKVFHQQNNPFKDYLSWGNKHIRSIKSKKNNTNYEKPKEVKLIPIVLCPDGKCDEPDWFGISFTQLIDSVKIYLSSKILGNPLNKWSVFARDFLLHLNSFAGRMETNMKSLNFVIENMQKIQELVDLTENTYEEIINHINNQIQLALGEEYEPRVRRHTWSGTPAFRFVGDNWQEWSDSVLNLKIKNHPMGCTVRMYIQNPTVEIVKKTKRMLSTKPNINYDCGYEGKNDDYWAASWDFNHFDLEEVTQLIVRNHKILNRVELEWKN